MVEYGGGGGEEEEEGEGGGEGGGGHPGSRYCSCISSVHTREITLSC